MKDLRPEGTSKPKAPWKIVRMIVILIFSAVISFCMNDINHIFADALLPDRELSVTLRVVPCEDGVTRGVTLISDGRQNEIFPLFEKKIADEGDGKTLDGWRYYQDKRGLTWTRVQGAADAKELTISLKEDPVRYFTVVRDNWHGDLEMTVNGGKPTKIEGYFEYDGEGERTSSLVQVRPFEKPAQRTDRTILRACVFIACTLIWCFVIYELTRNVRFGSKETPNEG